MSGPTVGYATLQIVPSAQGFAAALTGATSSDVERVGTEGGTKYGTAFKAAVGVAVAGIGAVIAGGVALARIGEGFDSAFDTIRIGTGATGEELAALQDSFRNVFTGVPTDMAGASTAIADINTRLGLTGEPLEALSEQFINLSRLTGTDLSSNISNISRVFGDWGVDTANQGDAMDLLFRASQATGIGIDSLSSQIVQFGAPLRQMGFGFDESAALLGKFEQEGVNAELVLGSMRQALGRMARAGEPAAETFERVVEEIQNAGDVSEANALAMELFGARAGPDMAAAIREGRFEIDDLVGSLNDSGETINGVASETDDWRESLTMLKNRVLVALEPVATQVFQGIGRAIEWAAPYIEAFAAWFAEKLPVAFAAVKGWFDRNWSTIQAAISTGVGVISAVLGTLRDAFVAAFGWLMENRAVLIGIAAGVGAVLVGMFTAWAVSAAAAAVATIAAAAPFIALGAAVAAVVAAVILAYQEWEGFRNVVDGVRDWIVGTLWPALQNVFNWLRDNVPPILQRIADFFTTIVVPAMTAMWNFVKDNVIPILTSLATYIAGGFKVGMDLAKTLFDVARTAMTAVWEFVRDNVIPILTTLATYIGAGFKVGMDLAVTLFGAVRTAAETVWTWIQNLWDRSEGLRAFIAGAFEVGLQVAVTVFGAVRTAIEGVWNWAQDLWDRLEGLRSFVAGLFFLGIDVGVKVFGALRAAAETVWLMVRDNVSPILEALRAFGVGAFQLGMGVIKAAVDAVADAFLRVVGAVRATVEWLAKLPSRLPSWVIGGSTDPTRNPAFSRNARGTSHFGGGLTLVGEEGPELVRLPGGSRVWSTQESAGMAAQSAAGDGGASLPDPDVWARQAAQAFRSEVRLLARAG